jgi:hypothetical protein
MDSIKQSEITDPITVVIFKFTFQLLDIRAKEGIRSELGIDEIGYLMV